MCLFVDGGGILCTMCDFIRIAQMSVTLSLRAQTGSFTRTDGFREKVLFNYNLSYKENCSKFLAPLDSL